MAIMGAAVMAIMVFPQLWDFYFIFYSFQQPCPDCILGQRPDDRGVLLLSSRGYGSLQY